MSFHNPPRPRHYRELLSLDAERFPADAWLEQFASQLAETGMAHHEVAHVIKKLSPALLELGKKAGRL